MNYEPELSFFEKLLKNMYINIQIKDSSDVIFSEYDLGLRRMILSEEDYLRISEKYFSVTSQPNVIYHIQDFFLCSYTCFTLPSREGKDYVIIGPYTTMQISKQDIQDCAEKLSLPPQVLPQLEKYYSDLPVLLDEDMFFSIINTLGERIWGSMEGFSVEYIQPADVDEFESLSAHPFVHNPEEPLLSMQILEDRYALESQLLQAVAQGLPQKIELILSNNGFNAMEPRVADPIRNFKNYTIVLNTLLRKGAEAGSVHPYYIDEISSRFARKIEAITSLKSGRELRREMFRKYCLLVKNHSMKGYSDLIIKVLTYIDYDLTADLSLNTLAKLMNVNPSYLSSLFKKDTGSTLTAYVSKKRVEHALFLLNTSNMQVQTIASCCGIADVNYFTKMFKKYISKTPKEYRKDVTELRGA